MRGKGGKVEDLDGGVSRAVREAYTSIQLIKIPLSKKPVKFRWAWWGCHPLHQEGMRAEGPKECMCMYLCIMHIEIYTAPPGWVLSRMAG